MKKKLNSWLDTPWTWRGYFRMCGISLLVYIPFMWYYLSVYGVVPSPKECFQAVKEKFIGDPKAE